MRQHNDKFDSYLSTSLIDITRRVVKDPQHGHNAVARSVCPTNVRLTGTNVTNGHSNATGILGNDGTILESVVDSINAVVLHAHEKARAHLRIGGAGIKERRRGVRKVALRQEIVRLNDLRNVLAMNADCHAHEHVLGAFGNLAVDFEEIGLFERLEAKVVQLKVAIVNDGAIENVLVLHDDIVGFFAHEGSRLSRLWVNVVVKQIDNLRKDLARHFVEIRDGNASCENGAVGMLGGKGSGSLCSESVMNKDELAKTMTHEFPRGYLYCTYSSSSTVVTPG